MSAALLPALKRGDTGPDVVELQMRLAGFRGTIPDGIYGPGTELQVQAFQRLVMGQSTPSGEADATSMAAIVKFGDDHPIDFAKLRCPCGQCGGFGRGKFKGLYRSSAQLEVYHRYEYPGVHHMLLWTVRAAMFHAAAKDWRLTINSAYRCSIDNANHPNANGTPRTSTNHHGKAIDLDIIGEGGTDAQRCDALRHILQEKANCQSGWNVPDRKSCEPGTVAPTWVHVDVRSYASNYLEDKYFVKSVEALDATPG